MTQHDSTRTDSGTPAMRPYSAFLRAWADTWTFLADSVLETNRSALRALGTPDPDDGGAQRPEIDSVAYTRDGWETERHIAIPGAVSVGDTIRFTKSFADGDVQAFADASGDTNRLHLDDAFAADTRFGRRLVHGTLVSGLISAALARLPGLTIYLSQDVQFLKPVYVGDRVTAVIEVVEDLGDDRYRLTTDVVGDDDAVYVDGEAMVVIDPLPDVPRSRDGHDGERPARD